MRRNPGLLTLNTSKMPQAARFQDLCTGHYCFPPRENVQGSPNVFINSRPAHRQTDAWDVHCCGLSCHDGVTVGGSGTVFCNSLPMARVTDPVSCGSNIMTGSTDVFVGE